MSEIRLGQRASSPDPIELAHVATKGYVDSQGTNLTNYITSEIASVDADIDELQDYVQAGIISDRAQYGDRYSVCERREATGQKALATGSLTISGGLVPATPWTTTVVPRVRFYVRAIAPAGAVITFAVYQGASRTALNKVGADVVATAQFASVGFKNVMLGTSVQLRDDLPYVYLAILRTGSGTPDPAMACLGPAALADLINPAATQMVSGSQTGQAALPATLDTSAAFTATGDPVWFALSF